jgi:hypothetical protein
LAPLAPTNAGTGAGDVAGVGPVQSRFHARTCFLLRTPGSSRLLSRRLSDTLPPRIALSVTGDRYREDQIMMSRRRALVVSLCLGTLVVGAVVYGFIRSPGEPGRADIDTSAFVAYPGSTMIKDSFQNAQHGRYIDTGSFSNQTQLIRRYRLSEPVPRTEFERWRNATYPIPGWQIAGSVDRNGTAYERDIGKRHHVLNVLVIAELEKPLVPEYEIGYSVS